MNVWKKGLLLLLVMSDLTILWMRMTSRLAGRLLRCCSNLLELCCFTWYHFLKVKKIWNSFYLLSFCTLWPKNLVLHILIHHLPTKLARSSLSMFMAKSITYSKPKSMLCWLTFWYDCLKAYSSLEGYSLSFCHFLDGITDIFVDNLHRKERGKCGIRGTELKLRMSLPHCSTDAASQFFQPVPVTTTPAGRTNWLWKPK